MSDQGTFVIVGASLAGATAAATLREEGFRGRIVLIGQELEPPYLRPPLSKDYLRGDTTIDDLRVHPRTFYAEHEVELRVGFTVVEIHRDGHEVILANGGRVRYDQLLVATGAEPRRLVVPGGVLPGIVSLRTIDDADSLRAKLAVTEHVVVIGGGWIGTEVAASVRQMGHEVTMIHRGAAPLQSVVGPEVAAVYRGLHAEHGVRMTMGVDVVSFEGSDRVHRVHTSDGESIRADLVIVGVGARPRADLAAAAGLEVDEGIVVDEYLRTADEAVFAAGDVASAWHPLLGCRLRVEHWSNAIHQGTTAARNMLGARTPADELPYFYSDQYDVSMEFVGHTAGADRVIFRGDRQRREFVAFWMSGNTVRAGMSVNVPAVVDPLRDLIAARHLVPDDRLTDVDVPLDDLAPVLTAQAPNGGDRR